MTALLRPALVLFTSLGLLTGVVYPLLVTALGQWLFPEAATGSLIRDGDRVLGSARIGQAFSDARFFWSRPSATAPVPYDASASTATNHGPSNPALHLAVARRIDALRAAGAPNGPVPADLVTASGSGLDPHVSPASAAYQAERVARARGIPLATVRTLIEGHTENRALGVLGEPRVNVLQLNLALGRIPQHPGEMGTNGSE